MEEDLVKREMATISDAELSTELGDAELAMVSGGRRGNEDDFLKDLEIQR
jgi:hypothetical protein